MTVVQSRRSAPGELPLPPPRLPAGGESPEVHGLTEATSNLGMLTLPDWPDEYAATTIRIAAVITALLNIGNKIPRPEETGVT